MYINDNLGYQYLKELYRHKCRDRGETEREGEREKEGGSERGREGGRERERFVSEL